ncbi:hypothetical protein LIER_30761 [Lithospermum erythrorhizon]|uniref:Uncharacterized protein n=1 Tax=Lithospermum erythrorhizon TaxID=34254 RepID=A0AAV3RS57_LITER
MQGSQEWARGCYLESTKRIKAQIEVGGVGPRHHGICILEVPEESPKKGQPHEEIRSIPFDESDPRKVVKIGTTLGAEHDARGRARSHAQSSPHEVSGYLCLGAKGCAGGGPVSLGPPVVC